MKFILAFSICSAITGFCDNTMTVNKKFDTWSECIGHGGAIIMDFSQTMKDHVEKNRLFISYFCNENHTNETTTESQPKPSKIPSTYFRS